MKRNLTQYLLLFSILSFSSLATARKEASDKELVSRIDFGNAYITGQTIKSGAVYLMHRKKSEIQSMLKKREHYRDEILEGFFIQNKKPVRKE